MVNPLATCPECGWAMVNNVIGRHIQTHDPKHVEAKRLRKIAHQRAYSQTPEGKATSYRSRHSDKGRAASLRATHKIRATREGQVALKARVLAYQHVKKGLIPRRPCEVCGSDKSTIHHPNGYEGAAALDIVFLCWRHHMEAHDRVAAA